jgi:oligoendopeptidase F
MIKKRSEVAKKYKWNIELMYANEAAWEKELIAAERAAKRYAAKYSGHLADSGKMLLAAFKAFDRLWQLTERVYVYARMKRDEDNANAIYQALADRSQALISKISASTSFFIPEFLAIPRGKLAKLVKEEDGLAVYDYAMRVMLRDKEHILSKKEENLLARLSEVLDASGDVFTMLNNADMRFGMIKDEAGRAKEVTHGNYIAFMESQNQAVRKAAYGAVYAAYRNQKNTLATTYSYNVKTDVAMSRVRSYGSSLERALAGDNVPVAVYENLIRSVNDSLPILHRYMDVKKRSLGLKKLAMYDVYMPLFKLRSDKVAYEDALGIMYKALAPLGKDYVVGVKAGVRAGWIDVFENENKTSGAYSFGSYDSMPYILMNYAGRMKDVFTLVHEMGHSMHSLYTREAQPFRYGSHSIFTAEVASTVNESLLIHYLLETMRGKAAQKYLLNMYIEEFRTTLFRQTMFAEFELLTHTAAECGEVLTSEFLTDAYAKLNEKYFGPSVRQDEDISYEWSRIPHFYRAFYVYKYATGFSAATALSERILSETEGAAENYISFLKTGNSDDPIELLKIAGVDMSLKEPVDNAMKVFEGLVDRLDALA